MLNLVDSFEINLGLTNEYVFNVLVLVIPVTATILNLQNNIGVRFKLIVVLCLHFRNISNFEIIYHLHVTVKPFRSHFVMPYS